MSVVQLHQPAPCNDVVETLRRIADDIESRRHGDWPVTTAIVVIGHTDSEVNDGDNRIQQNYWQTYGAGPRCDAFTTRGLLATVLSRWGHDHD
jgi:hypothetical protein